MAYWVKQSTAVTVKLGPFVDQTDGFTAETTLTISQADIRLSKNGGAFAQTNNAAGATHDENGYYGIPLDTTDTNTLGTLKVAVNESGALPAWLDLMVVPANAWDSLFGADRLQVDVRESDATTMNAFADAHLNRDMSAVSDTTARSPLNALRFLRNRWTKSGTTLTVYEEDDATQAWTSTLATDASADPVTGSDPA